jgi:hypothetical protein
MPRHVSVMLHCTLLISYIRRTKDGGGLAEIYQRLRNNAPWQSVEIR